MMNQVLVLFLMILAFVLPIVGAAVLRIVQARLSLMQMYVGTALAFGVAFISVIILAFSNVSSLQIGGLSLLLPVGASEEQSEPLSTIVPQAQPPTAVLTPTETLVPPTAVLTPTETLVPPTAVPTPTETLVPPTAVLTPTETLVPPTTTPPPPRTYRVKPGDTLRSIAEQFNVNVQTIIDANTLNATQADALKVGQDLVIP